MNEGNKDYKLKNVLGEDLQATELNDYIEFQKKVIESNKKVDLATDYSVPVSLDTYVPRGDEALNLYNYFATSNGRLFKQDKNNEKNLYILDLKNLEWTDARDLVEDFLRNKNSLRKLEAYKDIYPFQKKNDNSWRLNY